MHFVILISGSKSIKFAQKFRIFLKFLTLEGTLFVTLTNNLVKHDEVIENGSLKLSGVYFALDG